MAKKLAYFVKYLRMYWTDFRDLFTIALWVQMIDLYLIFRFGKVRCHGNQFCEKNGKLPTLSLWHS